MGETIVTATVKHDQEVILDTDPSVAATAALTAASRAKFPKLSHDPFAQHWLSPEAWKKYDEYISKSPKWEAELICLRNRFFLEDATEFFGGSEGVAIILGSGLTSMSYLFPENIRSLEVDSKQMIESKKSAAQALLQKNLLPMRDISYYAHDLTKELPSPYELQPNLVSHSPTYFLLEGLVYYLERSSLESLFTWISQYPSDRMRIGITFWKHEMLTNPYVMNYQKYLRSEGMESKLNFYEEADFQNWSGFSNIVKSAEYLDLAIQFGLEPRFASNEEIFGENFVVLEK
jgi:O-methyltransferase involved in polyketide biosynthesis